MMFMSVTDSYIELFVIVIGFQVMEAIYVRSSSENSGGLKW